MEKTDADKANLLFFNAVMRFAQLLCNYFGDEKSLAGKVRGCASENQRRDQNGKRESKLCELVPVRRSFEFNFD